MEYSISIKDFEKKKIYPLGEEFHGKNPSGVELNFTNYYMELNEKPFLGISGEFHFSRCDESRWEDEIIKMKMCGINIVSTYVFWIHHEEEEGIFDFEGRKCLRKFVELCRKHGMYVIIRIGPFCHGEARNGGIPDWLYGKSFEVRTLDEGFLFYVKRLYGMISKQIRGLLFKDGGPIIAAQIDNEYMHSSAPWEITTGISNEWIFGGNEGEAYMLRLRDEARKEGIDTPFYTCTGWGGAITPSSMMPLWGGYAYRPWLFYKERGEHPSTEEYVYQDFHNNCAVVTSDFKPAYEPETRPYACCEMGGGMMCTYNYRFQLPYKSVDAMANIKLGSGCNFLGYYVFQGGTNPIGKHGTYMNESQITKLSYDYQAPLGEFGQIRESYQRLKLLHYFCSSFGTKLCTMITALPNGASMIPADNLDTLRFAVRTDGESGFLLINNFQDHEVCQPKRDEKITIQMPHDEIVFEHISLDAEENCILPFHMNLSGIQLIKASAQPITMIENNGQITYIFLKPKGMKSEFFFEEGVVTDQGNNMWKCDMDQSAEKFTVKKDEIQIDFLCLTRELANQMYLLSDQTIVFANGAIMEDEEGVRLESRETSQKIFAYPKGSFHVARNLNNKKEEHSVFDVWKIETIVKKLEAKITQTASSKYIVEIPKDFMDGLKDVIAEVFYQGDIGHAFLDGVMINDNFYNGAVWEIGLRTYEDKLQKYPITISITPLKENADVNVESAMAARMEHSKACIGKLESVSLSPVYEIKLT